MTRLYPLTVACLLTPLLIAGCEQSQPDRPPAATTRGADVSRPILWKNVQGSTVVAVDKPDMQRQLAQATRDARQTLDDARLRWAVAKPAEHTQWAIKWAAPVARASQPQTASGSSEAPAAGETIEHVWVQPLTWSAFRVEGVLISEPISPLECGRARGESVSFAIDEISDWIHFASERSDAAFEGGYTVKVLQEEYGRVTGE